MLKDMKTFEADGVLGKGVVCTFREIFSELRASRWLLSRLFLKEITVGYKQYLLGMIWTVAIPVLSIAALVWLNRMNVFSFGRLDVPYPLYAFAGLAFWQFFASGIISCSQSLVINAGMVSRMRVNRKALVIASLAQPLLVLGAQLIMLAALFFLYGIHPHPRLFALPLALLPIVFLTLGFGFVCAVLNGLMRDVTHILTSFLAAVILITPVFYTSARGGLAGKITVFNPFYYAVSFPRDLMLTGSLGLYAGFLITAVFSLLVLIGGLVIFHLTEADAIERL
jgi:ABC-type polysaccharide/polyol phosphate export permease